MEPARQQQDATDLTIDGLLRATDLVVTRTDLRKTERLAYAMLIVQAAQQGARSLPGLVSTGPMAIATRLGVSERTARRVLTRLCERSVGALSHRDGSIFVVHPPRAMEAAAEPGRPRVVPADPERRLPFGDEADDQTYVPALVSAADTDAGTGVRPDTDAGTDVRSDTGAGTGVRDPGARAREAGTETPRARARPIDQPTDRPTDRPIAPEGSIDRPIDRASDEVDWEEATRRAFDAARWVPVKRGKMARRDARDLLLFALLFAAAAQAKVPEACFTHALDKVRYGGAHNEASYFRRCFGTSVAEYFGQPQKDGPRILTHLEEEIRVPPSRVETLVNRLRTELEDDPEETTKRFEDDEKRFQARKRRWEQLPQQERDDIVAAIRQNNLGLQRCAEDNRVFLERCFEEKERREIAQGEASTQTEIPT